MADHPLVPGRYIDEIPAAQPHECPVLVATPVTYCVIHEAIDHDDGRAWTACRFRQLFYFENPMDEHTFMWSDEIGAADHLVNGVGE